ncbi:hypothetical protein C5167_007053 [Papaver somniferum]|uniref:Uncharacterized protein n=1 Tax=Papaver somniferum TaxID=3469 RepID=A0A4Y7JJB0_PAPSO|nr:hypothetical protein C5167_007053 [Papaver somniferum]
MQMHVGGGGQGMVLGMHTVSVFDLYSFCAKNWKLSIRAQGYDFNNSMLTYVLTVLQGKELRWLKDEAQKEQNIVRKKKLK